MRNRRGARIQRRRDTGRVLSLSLFLPVEIPRPTLSVLIWDQDPFPPLFRNFRLADVTLDTKRKSRYKRRARARERAEPIQPVYPSGRPSPHSFSLLAGFNGSTILQRAVIPGAPRAGTAPR